MTDRLDPDPLTVSEPLVRLRAQPRSGCLGWLIAIAFGMLFWAAVGGIVVHVVAAPRSAPGSPFSAPSPAGAGLSAGSGTGSGFGVPAHSGAPHDASGEVVDGRAAALPLWPAGGAPLAAVTWTGTIGYADPKYGSRYLAIPAGPGLLVRVCGPARCLTRTSSDAGPSLKMQRGGRIADVSAADFPILCGVPIRYGLCSGTVLVLGRPRTTLPDTDTR